MQGLLIAVIAMLLYSFAVSCLGAAQTASFGALTPILALIGGAVLLGETISFTVSFGVVLVSVGVLLASGCFENWRQMPNCTNKATTLNSDIDA